MLTPSAKQQAKDGFWQAHVDHAKRERPSLPLNANELTYSFNAGSENGRLGSPKFSP
jgi:hypothetical protein